MKLLVDECVDERLRLLFPWQRLSNRRFANHAGAEYRKSIDQG